MAPSYSRRLYGIRVKVTARVKAVTPNLEPLLSFLKSYRDWTQYVVNEVWSLKYIPSMRELHYRFYQLLRSKGFRAHHCHKIERRARELVKAVKKNKGSKPVLRKLTARLDSWDYKLDLGKKTLRIAVLNNEWVELKLAWYSYLDKYLNGYWRSKEIYVSYRGRVIWVYIVFEKEVEFKELKTVMGVDVNFNNITYTVVDFSGKLVTMGVLPFRGLRKALHLRKLAEKLEKRYPKSWRFIKWVRRVRGRWYRRAGRVLADTSHYAAKKLVEIAEEYKTVIVLEDLEKLKEKKGKKSKKFDWEFSYWAYRKIQRYTEYKALLKGIQVVYVDAKRSSRTSPIGGRLKKLNYRWVELPNRIVTSRDVIASWNLALKFLKQMKGRGGELGPDSPRREEMKPQSKRGKFAQVSIIPLVNKI